LELVVEDRGGDRGEGVHSADMDEDGGPAPDASGKPGAPFIGESAGYVPARRALSKICMAMR